MDDDNWVKLTLEGVDYRASIWNLIRSIGSGRKMMKIARTIAKETSPHSDDLKIHIASSLSADELKLAILDSDVNKIKSVKGIGLKTAERIILELKDKINIDEIEDIKLSNNIGNTIRDEALSALSSLGISKNVVEHHIDSILEANKDINLEDLIKEILKRS